MTSCLPRLIGTKSDIGLKVVPMLDLLVHIKVLPSSRLLVHCGNPKSAAFISNSSF